MTLLGALHGRYVHGRRVEVLATRLAARLPRNARVLDVGCGDGLLAQRLIDKRPDVIVEGIDVLVRPGARIPVTAFDGLSIPHAEKSFDTVLLVDVVHHAIDPIALLREAARVASRAVLIKDHTRDGFLSGATLRFMDGVGNRRHGVALPYSYWTGRTWRTILDTLGLRIEHWDARLGLYPWPARIFFDRALHFIAELAPSAASRAPTEPLARVDAATICCNPAWEAAYHRFETTEEEVLKFKRRLVHGGARRWPVDARIVELFCGRGGGLHALSQLGFCRLDGVDLSESLLEVYRGTARLWVADCRRLPFETASKDVVIVQGGLHHLSALPDDLDRLLAEARRVLRPGGTLLVVEPWLTPFLRFVHRCCGSGLLRRRSPRLDALATMIEHERETYYRWLGRPREILALFRKHFRPQKLQRRMGKLFFVGTAELPMLTPATARGRRDVAAPTARSSRLPAAGRCRNSSS